MAHGTPTVIRFARVRDRIGMVISVSTPSSFTAHFHTYRPVGGNRVADFRSYGYWTTEKGACDALEQWVEEQGGYIE